jgi:hypothetical protein
MNRLLNFPLGGENSESPDSSKENVSQTQLERTNSNYTVVIKPLTAEEVHRIWEQTFIERWVEFSLVCTVLIADS